MLPSCFMYPEFPLLPAKPYLISVLGLIQAHCLREFRSYLTLVFLCGSVIMSYIFHITTPPELHSKYNSEHRLAKKAQKNKWILIQFLIRLKIF